MESARFARPDDDVHGRLWLRYVSREIPIHSLIVLDGESDDSGSTIQLLAHTVRAAATAPRGGTCSTVAE